MTDYTSRTVTKTRKEYALKSPTNWAEAEKVLAAIKRDLSDRKTWDYTVQIEARDDAIVFWFEVPNG